MPKCAGCSGGGGATGPTGPTGPSGSTGATGPSGGGSCTQKNMYTVSTVGPAGLGFYLGTAAPFLACADFVGDGVNDQVALQAAISASLAPYDPAFQLPTEVYLNTGIFILSASVNVQGVPLRGAYNTFITNAAAASGFNMIRNPGYVTNMSIGEILAPLGAAPIKIDTASVNSMYLDTVTVTTFGLGADLGMIYPTIATSYHIENCELSNSAGGAVIPAIYENGNIGARKRIIGNRLTGLTVDLLNQSGTDMNICNNLFLGNSSAAVVGNRGLINIIISDATTTQHHEISGNHIMNSPSHGIVVNGGAGGGLALRFLIHDNLIDNYGVTGASAYDGIFLAGNSDEHDIQGNVCHSIAAGARHGVNISAATCSDNFVSNNNLFNSGAGVSINDAGTTTVTAAGNRL